MPVSPPPEQPIVISGLKDKTQMVLRTVEQRIHAAGEAGAHTPESVEPALRLIRQLMGNAEGLDEISQGFESSAVAQQGLRLLVDSLGASGTGNIEIVRALAFTGIAEAQRMDASADLVESFARQGVKLPSRRKDLQPATVRGA
jgi:hypothetical protein